MMFLAPCRVHAVLRFAAFLASLCASGALQAQAAEKSRIPTLFVELSEEAKNTFRECEKLEEQIAATKNEARQRELAKQLMRGALSLNRKYADQLNAWKWQAQASLVLNQEITAKEAAENMQALRDDKSGTQQIRDLLQLIRTRDWIQEGAKKNSPRAPMQPAAPAVKVGRGEQKVLLGKWHVKTIGFEQVNARPWYETNVLKSEGFITLRKAGDGNVTASGSLTREATLLRLNPGGVSLPAQSGRIRITLEVQGLRAQAITPELVSLCFVGRLEGQATLNGREVEIRDDRLDFYALPNGEIRLGAPSRDHKITLQRVD